MNEKKKVLKIEFEGKFIENSRDRGIIEYNTFIHFIKYLQILSQTRFIIVQHLKNLLQTL